MGGAAVRVINSGFVFCSFVSGRLFGLSRSFVVCSFVRVRSGRSVGFCSGRPFVDRREPTGLLVQIKRRTRKLDVRGTGLEHIRCVVLDVGGTGQGGCKCASPAALSAPVYYVVERGHVWPRAGRVTVLFQVRDETGRRVKSQLCDLDKPVWCDRGQGDRGGRWRAKRL